MYKYKQYIEEWLNPEGNDKWVRFLPYKGSLVQAADLNTIQSLLNDQVSQVLQSLYKNGVVIKGGDIILRNNVCEVTPGILHVDGMLIPFSGTAFTIDLLSNHGIYIHIEEVRSLLTDSLTSKSTTSDLLLAPSQGTEVITLKANLQLDNPSLYPLGTISMGEVTLNRINSLDPLKDLIAISNYERFGNFIVEGLQASILNTNTTYSISNPVPISLLDASNTYIQNLEEALKNSIQAQTLIGNQIYMLISKFNEGSSTLQSTVDIDLLRDTLNSTSNNIEFFRGELKKAYDNLSRNTVSTPNFVRDVISIGPGVAYIQGHRVSLPTSSSIYIERDLNEQLIENAKYEVADGDTLVYRSIELSSGYTFADLRTLKNEVHITLENVTINNKTTSARMICVVDSALPSYVNTTQLLLDFIISELMFAPYNHPNIRFDSIGGSSFGVSVRNVMSSTLEVQRVSSNTISIRSVNNSLITLSTTTNSSLITWDKDKSLIGSTITSNNYTLSFTPVTRIKSLIADMQKRNEPIIKSATNTDILPTDTVFNIINIIQGEVRYIEGADYELLGTNQVRWLSNNTPEIGTLYYVTYNYTQPLTENEDFILSKIDNSIRFVTRPPSGNSFTLDYFYALNKRGYVYLVPGGNFKVITHDVNETNTLLPNASSLLIASFDITPNGLSLTPFNAPRIITPQLISLLEERLRIVEGDLDSLSTKYLNPEDDNLVLQNTEDFVSIEPNPQDSFAYNLSTGGITPQTKLASLPLSPSSTPLLSSDSLFTGLNYISLLEEEEFLWDTSGLGESTTVRLNRVNPLYTQPVIITDTNKLITGDPIKPNLSLVEPYSFVLARDTYKHGTSLYLDNIYRTFLYQTGNFITSIRDSLEYGSFNTLSLPPTYFTNSFFTLHKTSTEKVRVVIINLPSKTSGLSIKLNGNVINEKTIPLGNTTKDTNDLLGSDINGYLTFEINLPSMTSGTHIIDVLRGNDILVSNVIAVPPIPLISSINQNSVSWNKVPPISFQPKHTLHTRSVTSLITLNPNSSKPITQDSTRASGESFIQFFSPTQDVIAKGILLNVKSFDPRVRLIGVLRRATIDNDYYIGSYRTTEDVIGLLINESIKEDGEPTELKLTSPTPLYKGITYALCIYSYNADIELSSYEVPYPQPLLTLKGSVWGDSNNTKLFSPTNNLHINLNLLTYVENITSEVNLGTYTIENNLVPISHFSINTYPLILAGASIQFHYFNGSKWQSCPNNRVIPLPESLSSIQLRATCKTVNRLTSPIIPLKESSITLFTLDTSFSYTSKRFSPSKSYSSVDLIVDFLDDPYIEYGVEVGNDLDNIWTPINTVPSSLINLDTTGLFKRIRYRYVFPSIQSSNTLLMYRIKGLSNNQTRVPCIKKVTLYVYP